MMILVESGPALSLMSVTYGHALLEFRSDSCKENTVRPKKNIALFPAHRPGENFLRRHPAA